MVKTLDGDVLLYFALLLKVSCISRKNNNACHARWALHCKPCKLGKGVHVRCNVLSQHVTCSRSEGKRRERRQTQKAGLTGRGQRQKAEGNSDRQRARQKATVTGKKQNRMQGLPTLRR